MTKRKQTRDSCGYRVRPRLEPGRDRRRRHDRHRRHDLRRHRPGPGGPGCLGLDQGGSVCTLARPRPGPGRSWSWSVLVLAGPGRSGFRGRPSGGGGPGPGRRWRCSSPPPPQPIVRTKTRSDKRRDAMHVFPRPPATTATSTCVGLAEHVTRWGVSQDAPPRARNVARFATNCRS